jgi:basic amino acid/polyamine antiporter, APA family
MTFTNKIGFKATISLVIGNIIGVGIFTTTGYISNFLDSSFFIMVLWIFGGIYAISGAVVYGILAKEYPLSGGDFQYLKNEIHPLLGYMFGWSALAITYTGSIAALSIGAAYYFDSVFNPVIINEIVFKLFLLDWQIVINDEKIIAIILIVIFSWINYRGLRISANYQTVLTALIIIFILIFSISGLVSVKNINFLTNQSSISFSLTNFLTAFIAVIFTFIGWTSAVYIAEEIEEAKSIIPKSLFFGVLIVTFLYSLINFLYVYALPIEELKNTINVATFVSEHLWGKSIAVIVSFFIFIAVLSSLNSTILSGSRIYMAMSREGYLFGKFSDKHYKFGTPQKAILIQAIWSVVLLLSGSFNQLLSFVVFVIMIFSALAGIISIKLIVKQKNRLNLAMILSILYTLICIGVGINTFIYQFTQSAIGLIIIFVSFLFYLSEKREDIKNTTI